MDERNAEETPRQAWATGSEIAHETGIDEGDVMAALRALGNVRLHVRAEGDDIEVLGVDHGPASDSAGHPVGV